MAEFYYTDENLGGKRAILVGLNTEGSRNQELFNHSMQELSELCRALDLETAATVTQMLDTPERATLVGIGKVHEVQDLIPEVNADIVIFNQTLTPMQVKNLEHMFDTEVLDRAGLILQIFARRAKTREARLQVESAQLEYMLPKLAGMRTELSRQGGGSGRLSNKGAGEKKIELDRRRIEHRMSEVRRDLESISLERSTQRKRRLSSGITRVSLVGYTNAGKSTILNRMLELYGDGSQDKKVLEKNMLFATLDTQVRNISAPGHKPFLLSDTVGFISDLPTNLVKAFRSTLEEAKYSNVLLEVIDYSDPSYQDHIDVTARTLRDIGASDIPIVYVYNKADLVLDENGEQKIPKLPLVKDDRIYISGKMADNFDELIGLIEKAAELGKYECDILLPYDQGKLITILTQTASTGEPEYLEEGVKLHAFIEEKDKALYEQYILDN